jgi:NADH-quinone oxidoreductase subunit A
MSTVVLWPLILYFALVFVVVAVMLGLSYILGERHSEKATNEPYESGMPLTGSARLRFDVKFYMIAIFFVLFDLETVFLFAWAVAFREVGWLGYAEAVVFVGILLVALVYLWRIGALDWGTLRQRAGRFKEGQ